MPGSLLIAATDAAEQTSGVQPGTLWILVLLALIAGGLVWFFVKNSEGQPVASVVVAIIGHVAFLGLLGLDLSGFGCVPEVGRGKDVIEFEVAEVKEEAPEPEPEEPEPEAPEPEEPEPEEPEVEPEIKPQDKKPTPKKVKDAPVSDEPVSDEPPPPPMRFDLSNTADNSNTGVSVQVGNQGGVPGGVEGGKGDPKDKGQGSRPEDAEVGGEAAWAPKSEVFIKDKPLPVNVPVLNCPATKSSGVEGEVVLKVQVTKDGKIRRVKVVKGIGNGCDKVAVNALRKARFKPAVGTNGQKVDYELRYTYEFRLND